MTFASRLAGLCAVLAGAGADAQVFYQPSYEFALKGADAAIGLTNVTQMGGFLFLQLGAQHVVAVNTETGSERWRFSSKSAAVRRIVERPASGDGDEDVLLIEAEQLVAIRGKDGAELWQFPLNCHSATACNTRVRSLEAGVAVLSGYDKRDDNLLLLDVNTGQRLWPNWVSVPDVAHLVLTPSVVVVGARGDPYSIVALDRFTGRERWRFRPDAADVAPSGLVSHGELVTAWWSSKSADTMYSVDVATGKSVASWVTSKRANNAGERRGGGPGFFVAWQPALVGAGGVLKSWDPATGKALASKSLDLVDPPEAREKGVFGWIGAASGGLAYVAIDPRTGAERWRLERPKVTAHRSTPLGGVVLLRFVSEGTALAAVVEEGTGRLLGIGPLLPDQGDAGQVRFSAQKLFAFAGPRLQRAGPVPGTELVRQFEGLVQGRQMAEAKQLHEQLKPFARELPAAAEVHKKATGKDIAGLAKKLEAGGVGGKLLSLIRSARDESMLDHQDYIQLAIQVGAAFKGHDLGAKLSSEDRGPLTELSRRLLVLCDRFERQILADKNPAAYAAMTAAHTAVGSMLVANGESEVAHQVLGSLWYRAWVVRSPALEAQVRASVRVEARRLLPQLERAIQKGQDQDAAMLTVLDLKGLGLVVPDPPPPEAIPDMKAPDYQSTLEKIRTALR